MIKNLLLGFLGLFGIGYITKLKVDNKSLTDKLNNQIILNIENKTEIEFLKEKYKEKQKVNKEIKEIKVKINKAKKKEIKEVISISEPIDIGI